MQLSGPSAPGRAATRLAAWFAPPYKGRVYLASLTPRGYVSHRAVIHHDDVRLGDYSFVGDRVIFYQAPGGGRIETGPRVKFYEDILVETSQGGYIKVGEHSRIHRNSHLMSYLAPIEIGRDVGISQNCAIYSYSHSFAPDSPMSQQPLQTKGPIVIDDHATLGVGVTVMSGVRIGKGAMVGPGSLVTSDIPDGTIAVGSPARVVRTRSEIGQ